MIVKICSFLEYQSAITQLRRDVFVKEQGVPEELELDGLDPLCKHAVIFVRNVLVGTGRLTPEGHIGRVAVDKSFRNQGLGRHLMQALEQEARTQGFSSIALSAQITALSFYKALGYTILGPAFKEAGIEHLPMSKVLNH